jgi:hypothetical protein
MAGASRTAGLGRRVAGRGGRARRWSLVALVLVPVAVAAACTGGGAAGGRSGEDGPGRGGQGGGGGTAAAGRCADAGAADRWRELAAPPADGSMGAVVEDVLGGADGAGGVAAGGADRADRWLAVGARVVTDQEVAPAVWRYRDGRWVADRTSAVTLFGRQQRLIGVGRHDRRLVAMGLYYSDFEGRARPSAWTEQGGTWHEVPTLRELFGGPRTVDIKDVAAGELGFVVVGARDDRRGRQMAGVWRSRDGADWEWPPQDTPLTGRPDEVVTPLAVAAGPSGIVVVGTTLPVTHLLPRVEDGAAWWSGDGRTWERVRAEAAFGGDGTQQPTAVTWTGSAFVAVGVAAGEVGGRLRPAAWVSPDGRSWRRAPADAFAGADGDADARLTTLAVADGCVVAGGLVGTTPHLWTSGDGVAWAPLASPSAAGQADPRAKVLAGTGGGELLMVVSEPRRSRMWTSAMPSPP